MKQAVKGAVKSKTIWLAVIVGALPQLIEAMPLLEEVLAEHYKPVLYAMGGLLAVLRSVTTHSLEEKGA